MTALTKRVALTGLALAFACILRCGSSQASDPFDLAVNFAGMTPHIGQLLTVKLFDSTQNIFMSETSLQAVPSDSFQIDLGRRALSGHSYAIDFFADLNRNGVYDKPPTDHAWRIGLREVTHDTGIAFNHSTGFTDVNFPAKPRFALALFLVGMKSEQNKTMRIMICDSIYSLRVKDTVITAGADTLKTMLGRILVEGRSYRADLFIDENRNGVYDRPPVDHAWRIAIAPAGRDTAVLFQHSNNFVDISGF
jgi:uncharacterized protein (DUF2141 family)